MQNPQGQQLGQTQTQTYAPSQQAQNQNYDPTQQAQIDNYATSQQEYIQNYPLSQLRQPQNFIPSQQGQTQVYTHPQQGQTQNYVPLQQGHIQNYPSLPEGQTPTNGHSGQGPSITRPHNRTVAAPSPAHVNNATVQSGELKRTLGNSFPTQAFYCTIPTCSDVAVTTCPNGKGGGDKTVLVTHKTGNSKTDLQFSPESSCPITWDDRCKLQYS